MALSVLGRAAAAESHAQPLPASLAAHCARPLSGASAGDCSRPEGLEQLGMNTAYTVDAGEVEVDLVLAHGASRDARWNEVRGEVTYGVSQAGQVELGVATRRSAHGSESVREDLLELEGKWTIHDASPALLAASLGVEVTPRRGPAAANGSGWGIEASLVATRPWPAARIRGHVEVGIALEGLEEIEAAWLNVAVERPIHPALILAISGRGRVGTPAAATVVPGLAWRPGGRRAEGVVVAVGIPLGLTAAAEGWGVTFHLEIEL